MKYFWIFPMFVSLVHGVIHCEVANNTDKVLILGFVNVIYLSDTSCKLRSKEIEMLHNLYKALSDANIQIKVIISGPTHLQLPNDEFNIDENNIFWNEFGKTDGHMLIFDRCGRYTYEVIRPWSSVRQYVKAAILSTYYDHPCEGSHECPELNLQIELPDETKEKEDMKKKKIPVYPKLSGSQRIPNKLSVKDGKVQMRVVMRVIHTHEGDNKTYEHIEIQTGNKGYHGHPEDDTIESEEDENEETDTNNNTVSTTYKSETDVDFHRKDDSTETQTPEKNEYFDYMLANLTHNANDTNENENTETAATVPQIDNIEDNNLKRPSSEELNEEIEDAIISILMKELNSEQDNDSSPTYNVDNSKENNNKGINNESKDVSNNNTHNDTENYEKLLLHYYKIMNRLNDDI